MLGKPTHKGLWTGVPPWIFIGAVVILFPIFTFMTVENINRQKENSLRLLLEKGAALIRSFEAGTRTGLMGMQWGRFQLQKLLTETAQQPDIVYLLVAEIDGRILAHDDPEQIGNMHGRNLDLKQVAASQKVNWRIVSRADGRRIFEVFRKFAPTGGPMGMHRHQMMFFKHFRSPLDEIEKQLWSPPVIFVGLDMSSMKAARSADMRHTIIMGAILLLVGFAGIVLLFLAQGYRTTKASLSRIKAFSDNLVENMPIGLLATDSEKRIVSLNNVAATVLQLSPEESVGKDAHTLLPQEISEPLQLLESGEESVEKEIECQLSDQKVVPLEINATLLRDEKGSFLGHVILFKDLTEVRTLKKEVARSQRLASVGRLAAGVAHEVRNPLSSIKGFATYFKERYHNVPEDIHIAQIMIKEVDRLNRVVGQLLEFARPITLTKKAFSINTLITDSLKMVERQADEANVDLKVQLLPDSKDVILDPDKISQVLLNLYLNAIESMRSGGELSVTISVPSEKNGIEINVADTGAGIRPEDLAHVFDPYFTTKTSGTGLGLAIVHNILEAHAGQIKIKSHLEAGTTITLVLPDSNKDLKK